MIKQGAVLVTACLLLWWNVSEDGCVIAIDGRVLSAVQVCDTEDDESMCDLHDGEWCSDRGRLALPPRGAMGRLIRVQHVEFPLLDSQSGTSDLRFRAGLAFFHWG
jgi:hypothetical protein